MSRRNTSTRSRVAVDSDAAAMVRRGLILSLAWTRAQLALMRPEDFSDPGAYQMVLARRHKAMQRRQRLLSVICGTAS